MKQVFDALFFHPVPSAEEIFTRAKRPVCWSAVVMAVQFHSLLLGTE
jgi:hypothetical protein